MEIEQKVQSTPMAFPSPPYFPYVRVTCCMETKAAVPAEERSLRQRDRSQHQHFSLGVTRKPGRPDSAQQNALVHFPHVSNKCSLPTQSGWRALGVNRRTVLPSPCSHGVKDTPAQEHGNARTQTPIQVKEQGKTLTEEVSEMRQTYEK